MAAVATIAAPSSTQLHRIGSLRGDGPLSWPSLAYLRSHGGGAGRFDNPRGAESAYTVLYAAPEIRTCYLETLDQFRADARFITRVTQLTSAGATDTGGDFDDVLHPEIPDVYFAKRIGTFRLTESPDLLDVRLSATETAAVLSLDPDIAPILERLGYRRVTPGDLVGSVRLLTQAVSLWAYSQGLGGIVYNSCHEPKNAVCWALFSRPNVRIASIGPLQEIDRNDPDLLSVVRQFNLRLS